MQKTAAENEEETALKNVDCSKPLDCNQLDGTYCDVDVGRCLCKPDYPVTDTNHCYKGMINDIREPLVANLLQNPNTTVFANWTFSAKYAIRTPNAIVTLTYVNVSRATSLNLTKMASIGVSVSLSHF